MSKDFQYTNTYLSLISTLSESDVLKNSCQANVDDSIELILEKCDDEIEVGVIRYLRELGIEMKTDPCNKEQQYWIMQRQVSAKKIDHLILQSDFKLNLSVNKIMEKKISQTYTFIKNTLPLQKMSEKYLQ